MRTKVLISVDEDDLVAIDKHATKAGMSRSEYLVAMGRQGSASLFEAIAHLRAELLRFEEEADPAWKSEVERLEGEVKRLSSVMENVRHAMPIVPAVLRLLKGALQLKMSSPVQATLKAAISGLAELDKVSLVR